ncbi:efflux RND transporter permease subunit [Peribacillus glennii]|uniref:Efflux RND transporter permease subunit n=1 Tax=Peribacillus glennii TaxID=2303991 RepID=A0A372LAW2_9BACI|nr:efflux RND transporter permease subunit [Peribacillus glennii]RFU62003.1 efflux RND transporter permease subunit [Peribacillus glennii]
MSWFTNWAFKNKAAVSLMSVLVLTIGIISYIRLPMEFLPTADQPFISIVTMGQGMDSNTMEEQVTNPIEDAISTVNGKINIFSTTGDGYSMVDIHLESKTNKKEAKQEIEDALAQIKLPESAAKPNVVQLNTTMIPIANVAITFKDGVTPHNLDFANEKLAPYFEDIKGVSNVQTYGKVDSYISVDLDNKKMAGKQVSVENAMTVLQGQNMAMSVGEKTIEGKTASIKVVGDIKTLDELKQLQVTPKVKLTDISTIELKKPENNLTRINGEDGLLFSVTKESNSNAVSLTKKVREATKEINKKYNNAEATVILASADMVEDSVHSMIKEVLLGALFATIIIMVFLRNIRSTFITIVSIPLSLCFTLFLLSQSGVTLNILTLGGVAVAVGRLVDDSIVVIENIFRKMQTEKFSIGLIMEATKEVGAAITSSTLTTVAVFLPLGLVNGGLQELVLPFALTITYSLLASLIVALTVVPLMSAGLLKNAKLAEHKPSMRFSKFLTWSLNHKWIILTLSLLLFFGSIGAYFTMPKGTISKAKSDFIDITLSYPSDTPLDQVKESTLELEKFALKQAQAKYVYTQLGNSPDAIKYGDVRPPTQTMFMVLLKDGANEDKFIKAIESQEKNFSDATLKVGPASMWGGSATAITIDIVGEDFEKLEKTADKVKSTIQDIKGIETVVTNQDEKKTVYSLVVDPAEAKTQQVAQQMGVMLNQTPIGSISLEGQQTTVLLEPALNPKSQSDIEQIPVMSAAELVPLSKLAEVKMEEKTTSAFHKDGEQYIRVTANVDPKKLSEISADIKKEVFGDKTDKGIEIPKDVEVLVGGASVDQASDFADMFMTMLISIGLVFLIMVITFKTFRAPIAILCSLPLAAIGAVTALLISRISVDPTALLGALMLIGIVVTNAIVLLDRTKHNEQTMIIRDAIVEAATTRMRPILMTAVATICAMLPLLFKETETANLVSASLAVVVIGGLSAATLLTLVVIPVVYELLHFKKSKKQRLAKEEKGNIDIAG